MRHDWLDEHIKNEIVGQYKHSHEQVVHLSKLLINQIAPTYSFRSDIVIKVAVCVALVLVPLVVSFGILI